MTDEIVFYTNPMSRGRIVRCLLEEVGQPYRTVVVDYAGMKAPDYLAINPMGKVPAIRHGETVVTENAAVCAYLAELVPEKGLAPPAGSPERGDYYRWLFFLAGPVEAMFTAKHAGAFAAPMNAGYGSEADVLRVLEQAVAGREHLVGDRFTAADLYLTAALGWGMYAGGIEKRPAFERYVQPIMQREAYVRATATDDALMAPHPFPG